MIPTQPDILLIEDSAYEAELTFKAMRAKMPHVEYLHLRDGSEALDYLFRRGSYQGQLYRLPALMLLDLDLPSVKGMHLLEQLKTNPTTRRIPIIVFTVSNRPADMEQAYDLGANSFVVKPMNFVKFSLAVADIVHYWLVLNDLPNHVKTTSQDF